MIVGTPDPKCICCRPDNMPYHWHHDHMGVDVYPPRSPNYGTAKVSISGPNGGDDLTPAEALEMARHLVDAAEIAQNINSLNGK